MAPAAGTANGANGANASVLAFDPAAALEVVDDDRDLLAKMVEMFCAQRPKMLAAIQSSVAAADAVALGRAAHALKGSVGNFGPTESFDSARELERMGRDGVLAGAADRCKTLEEQLVRLERDLSAFVEPAGVP